MVASKIDSTFWIGTSQAPGYLVDGGKIKGVMNCAFDLDIQVPDGVLYAKVPLVDGPGNALHALIGAALCLRQIVELGKVPVLVHCHSGSSRSVVVLATYLAWQKKWTVQKALALIQSQREIAAPKPELVELASRSVDLLSVLLW